MVISFNYSIVIYQHIVIYLTQGACKQDEQWTITLWLHDENGSSRKLSVTVETDDANADLYPPVSDAFVEIMGMEYQDNIEYIGTCNQNYPKYRITLDEDGQIPITFNASNSSDADAVDGAKGIERYEWEVFYDKPYNDPITTAACNGIEKNVGEIVEMIHTLALTS